ncbi:hypothetical protein WJ97_12935 [Burkholderia ubonensis]|uniref:hypothetical protein n=1 Tax=Burkholderia ubonensis TaxID=101571 RepID=UPI00075BBACD|nr:hypothetical protein [Burkholderia ubonensis]KVP96779.1 hypothetical protein WJ97_12935 [Burkholderia ubonensis]
MHNGFSNVQTTSNDAAVKLALVEELSRFVQRGLDRFCLPSSQVRMAPVVNAIKAALADSMLHGHTERMSEAAARERLLEAYLTEYDGNCKLYLKEAVVPVRVTRWDEEASAIAKRYESSVEHKTPEPSLDGALTMAWLNLRRAQQRWIAWLCLGAMLHNTPQGRERDSAEVRDLDTVARTLMGEVRGMEKRVLMFALLKGGEAAEKARKWLLQTTLCQGMSVMEFLEFDGQLPSSWRADDEKSLRASFHGEPALP